MKQNEARTIVRLAIPVISNEGLESRVSRHFGKSPGFIVVDSDGGNWEFLESKTERRSHECAPIRGLVERGSRALLCCSMGRGALARSHEAGLQIYQATGGPLVRDALEAFRAGACPDLPDSALCNHGHSHEEAGH